jgi:phage repressor protein C with HTH and peptisase S24 domain
MKIRESPMLFGQMVAKAREEKGITLRELARRVDASAATISKIENLDHIPRDSLLEELIDELTLDKKAVFSQVARQKVAHYNTEVTMLGNETALSPVPIVGKVTAGSIIEAPDWEDGGYAVGTGFDAEMVPLRRDEQSLYGLTVEGDSMEPVFSRGDYVFAAPYKTPRNNGFAVVRLHGGEVLLKKVIIGDDSVILQSANPAYQTLTVKKSDIIYIHPITLHRLSG